LPSPQPPAIRAGRDADAAGFIALIGDCWAEYPGCVMNVDGEVPELRALASYFSGKGGALWAAEAAGEIVGVVGVAPGAGFWEICKMYVARAHRGSGLANALLGRAEAHAREAGAARLELWSDTRFERAHAFYAGHGYVRAGAIRVLNDLSNSLEFHFAKPVNGVEVLDAAAAASAERRLAEILVDCVDAGAAVSYLPPLAPDVAREFYRRAAADVAAGRKILLAGWVEGTLAGTLMLDVGTPPNQPHRAEVQKVLVHPDARRRGLARALMLRAEQAAMQAGRTLLTLDTRAGDHAEGLYRGLGWTEAGRIPGYALNADGTTHATVLFFKHLPLQGAPPRDAAG
jgi:ribosomal protein S18 acetylase RimI-like enzyme